MTTSQFLYPVSIFILPTLHYVESLRLITNTTSCIVMLYLGLYNILTTYPRYYMGESDDGCNFNVGILPNTT
ncbi:uncharacterized protein GGS25DRAFT_473604 [Hypoxylon fragiforme]|uniref:uncharacterized protein n=1 Tax=Hypoxylon fragiforme TaxID=63214 RepID=UPI0020C6D7E5|nr:uncharacterized protein GGS25DRAFT_473604 [Hypoxylon fragiforme]KAI2612055.1 hypothetical protein GGS25DRAFT_473604 [Hypoxylon fragiforme]